MSLERKNLSSAATPERQTENAQNNCANSTTAYPACQVENLPKMLRKSGQFCFWKAEPDGKTGRLAKKPYNPRTGEAVSSHDRSTFAPLKTALVRLQTGGYSGLGVGLFGNLGAIDIDHCSQDGKWSALANDIVQTMDAYTEVSPSGQGIRILFTVPEGFQYDTDRYFIMNQKLGLEIYIAGATWKFVTVTGNVLRANDLLERGTQMQTILENDMQRPVPKGLPDGAPNPSDTRNRLSDTILVKKACQTEKEAAHGRH